MSDHRDEPASWALEQYKAVHEHELELNKATAAFEHAALQPLFLLTGGALVAFLTLLGAIWKESHAVHIGKLAWPLIAWSVGLVFAAAATAMAYRSQRSFTKAVRTAREQIEFQQSLRKRGPTDDLKTMRDRAAMLQNFAMFAGGAGLGSFILGVFLALSSLSELQ
jgi:nitroreductase